MPSRPGTAPRVRTAETFALGFDVPSVEAVRVVSGGEAAVLRQEGVDWSITLPTTSRGGDQGTTAWPANAEAARVLVNELATQSIEAGSGSREDSEQSAGGDGDEPLAVVTVELPAGETTIAVTAAPIGGRLPVRITDSAGTSRRGFVAASRFRPTDAGQLAALAEPRPLATGGVVTEVRLAPRDGTGFAIERVGGLWQIAGGDPGSPSPRLHQPTVRGMLEDLGSIRAASVIVPADVGPIEDPFLTIETVSDLPRARGEARRQTASRLVVAGQSTLEGMTNAVAVRSGGEGDGGGSGGGSGGEARLQIHLDPQAFPALPADVASLLDPVPLPWDAGDTAEIVLTDGDGELWLEFRRTLDGWVRVTDAAKPLDPNFSDALRLLATSLSTGWSAVERSVVDDDPDEWARIRLRSLSSNEEYWLRVSADEGSLRVSGAGAAWTLPRSPENTTSQQMVDALNALMNIDPLPGMTPGQSGAGTP